MREVILSYQTGRDTAKYFDGYPNGTTNNKREIKKISHRPLIFVIQSQPNIYILQSSATMKVLYTLLLSLLFLSLAYAQDGQEGEREQQPNCDAICAERVDAALAPVRNELDFVVGDRNELKVAYDDLLRQREDLQHQVVQANERSDGFSARVNELERSLQAAREEMQSINANLATALAELEEERSNVGFLGRLEEEIKAWYGAFVMFWVKLFKLDQKKDNEL